MDKEILEHQAFAKQELRKIAKKYPDPYNEERATAYGNLWRYNQMEIRNFQHERHIHLLVTITFGFIMLGSWVTLFLWLAFGRDTFCAVTWPLAGVVLILSVLEGAYLRFYYHLENWTQRLYALDKEIYRRLQACNTEVE